MYTIPRSWCHIVSTEGCGPCLFLVAKVKVIRLENKESWTEAQVFFLPGFHQSSLVFSCCLALFKDRESLLCPLLLILVLIFLSSFSHTYQDALLISVPYANLGFLFSVWHIFYLGHSLQAFLCFTQTTALFFVPLFVTPFTHICKIYIYIHFVWLL